MCNCQWLISDFILSLSLSFILSIFSWLSKLFTTAALYTLHDNSRSIECWNKSIVCCWTKTCWSFPTFRRPSDEVLRKLRQHSSWGRRSCKDRSSSELSDMFLRNFLPSSVFLYFFLPSISSPSFCCSSPEW